MNNFTINIECNISNAVYQEKSSIKYWTYTILPTLETFSIIHNLLLQNAT